MNTPATVDRLMAHVMRGDEGTCWLWTGAVNNKGYAQVGDAGRTRSAHRVSYELHVSPIEPGLTIDHTCHNADPTCAGGPSCRHRRCINPAHLEVVTAGVNIKRRLRGKCPSGHAYTPENTAFRADNGRRCCLTCRQAQSQKQQVGYGKRGRPSNADRAAMAAGTYVAPREKSAGAA